MGLYLTFIALWIVTVSGETKELNLLETLYEKAASPTTDQHHDYHRYDQRLANDEGASKKPCSKSNKSKKDASENLHLDDPTVKHQVIYAAVPNLNPRTSLPNCRRLLPPKIGPTDTPPKIKTIEDHDALYDDTDLVGLDSIVEAPLDKNVPFYLDMLRDEWGNYPEPGEYDYVFTTEPPPTPYADDTTHPLEDFLIHWRKKNDEATNPLDKNEMQREIPLESQTNVVSSGNEEITVAKTNIDCGDEKQTANTKYSDEAVLYRRSNSKDTANPVIDLNTETKKVEDVVKSRSGGQQARKNKKNGRICYACSTASNPNCLVPNNRTTIKYCQGDRDSCVTKTFVVLNNKDTTVLTRDCGSSCSEDSIPGVYPPYSKCDVCHEDLCNSAFSFNNQNLIFLCLMFFITVTMSLV